MDLKGVLEELGLNESEAEIYLELLNSGESTANKLSKKLDLSRRLVYDYLYRLAQKGFVSSVEKESNTLFSVAPSAGLMELAEQREEKSREVKKALSALMPLLEKKGQEAGISARVLAGHDSVKTLFADTLREEENVYWLSVTFQAVPHLGAWYKKYTRERLRKGIDAYFLTVDTPEIRQRRVKALDTIGPHFIRFIDKSYLSPVVTAIYGSKLAFILWKEKPEVLIIESRHFSQVYRKYFKLLWKTAKPFKTRGQR
ncbi:hypothetical protein HZC09_00210 [Candidatus Micrarchaeota archaeon]|nr:hypothetical protein [Candidatus Micrarchaeota archaeon]